MTNDIGEALDWLGNEVNCLSCRHLSENAAGLCRLKHACVNDRYARRIDRFFTWNPSFGNSYIGHPHFEVRAIAARHADIFLLPPLLDDPEETVRWNAARRLPRRHVLRLRSDPHREVRIRIASLLDPADLAPMADDPDYYVRLVVARRVPPPLLACMIDDEEPEVRRVVASRVPAEWLLRITTDPDSLVRLEAARCLAPYLLSRLKHDPDWRVRYEVARRSPLDEIHGAVEDDDLLVRELVQSRLRGGQAHQEDMTV